MYIPPIAILALVLLWSLMHVFAAIKVGLSAYGIGLAVGTIIAPILPAYLIALIVWFASKKSQFASSITFTVVFLAIAASALVRNLSAPERLQKQSITGEFTGSTQECEILGKAWPAILSLEQDSAQEQKKASEELQQLDATINSPEFSDLTRLTSKDVIQFRREALGKYRDLWKQLATFIASPVSPESYKLKNPGIPAEAIRRGAVCVKNGLDAGMKKTSMKTSAQYIALAEARQAETQAVIDMYSHLEKHWGNWEIQDGVPVFTEPDVMDDYNAIIQNIEKLSAKAQAVIAESAAMTE